MYVNIYIYIYVCIYVCMCMYVEEMHVALEGIPNMSCPEGHCNLLHSCVAIYLPEGPLQSQTGYDRCGDGKVTL